jgi:hypothetical protein
MTAVRETPDFRNNEFAGNPRFWYSDLKEQGSRNG